MYIFLPGPTIVKRSTVSKTIGRSVEVASFIERWIGGDKMHRFAVHAAQHGEVVMMKQTAILPIRLGVGLH